ncbi:MAG TPA: hypothetical protein VNN10_08680 [Dehalococcoidia bacterium]|nr:hypothetical protein [Dehalococcoidia bacterium]
METDWQKVVSLRAGPERDREIAAGLRKLPYLEGEELAIEVRRLIDAEYSLDDEGLRSVSIARLRALLELDDDGAAKVAEAYDRTMNTMPGDIAFRRAATVQTLARHEFSAEEEARLKALLPNVFGEKPAELSVDTPGPQAPVRKYPGRRWWQFWQRKKAEAEGEADIAEEVARKLEEQRAQTTEAALDHFSRNRPV